MTKREVLMKLGFEGSLLNDLTTYWETNYPSSTEDCAALAAIANKHGEDAANLDLAIGDAQAILAQNNNKG